MNKFINSKLMNNTFFEILLFFILVFGIYNQSLILFNNYKTFQNTKNEYENKIQKFNQLKNEEKQLLTTEDKEKYFRQEYKLSKKDEILFSFPD